MGLSAVYVEDVRMPFEKRSGSCHVCDILRNLRYIQDAELRKVRGLANAVQVEVKQRSSVLVNLCAGICFRGRLAKA